MTEQDLLDMATRRALEADKYYSEGMTKAAEVAAVIATSLATVAHTRLALRALEGVDEIIESTLDPEALSATRF